MHISVIGSTDRCECKQLKMKKTRNKIDENGNISFASPFAIHNYRALAARSSYLEWAYYRRHDIRRWNAIRHEIMRTQAIASNKNEVRNIRFEGEHRLRSLNFNIFFSFFPIWMCADCGLRRPPFFLPNLFMSKLNVHRHGECSKIPFQLNLWFALILLLRTSTLLTPFP